MAGAPRKNVQCVIKTFRFDPKLVKDMELVMQLTGEEVDGKVERRYSSMTNLVMTAITQHIRGDITKLESQGVIWEHLASDFKESSSKEN